ncbi:MAG TPA: hypothetical protein VFB06_34340 [Streptosporangiaceae bacterium]|nr:hypothetical protein [Streptosporangiaceae bacterium]
MSFSTLYAERARDVTRALSAPVDETPFRTGGTLGELTRAYLAAVAELVPGDQNLIVKASGHSDAHWTSVTIEVGCAQPIPPVPAEDTAETPQTAEVPEQAAEAVTG